MKNKTKRQFLYHYELCKRKNCLKEKHYHRIKIFFERNNIQKMKNKTRQAGRIGGN